MSQTKSMGNEAARGVTCAKCGHANESGASYCDSCRSHLFVVCLECNRRSERTGRRCVHCGARLHRSRVKREVREAGIQVKRMGWTQLTLVVAAIVLGFAIIVGVMNFRINFF